MSSACCVDPGVVEPCAGQTLDQQHVTNERDTQQTMDDQRETDTREIRKKGATQKMHRRDRDKRLEEPRGPGPFFFFGGNNGASIVVLYCESRGWQRIYDKTRLDYKLKWCEIKSPATYFNFKAGSQLLYQIPNNKVLTTKIGLLNSLREYERVSSKVNYGCGNRGMKMEDFFPVTYRMDMKEERDAFFNGVCDDKSSMWICKPTGLNQGRGIFLLRTSEDIATFRERLQNKTEQQSNRKSPFTLPQARIVQEYIQNPLLLMGRKFDVRSYFLIASTSPYMVFFRHGYIRLTCNPYDPKSDNITAHLTNQYMQKKNPLYSLLKEDTVWSMEHFNDYINEIYMAPKGLPKDWALGPFAKRMQHIIMQCFQAVKAKLDCKLGYFDLIGCDFLIDENFKVWLLEMNCNPALHTNCEVLKEVIPSTVTETLDLVFEIFNKCCCGSKLLPLNSQRDFVLLHDGESTAVGKQRHKTTGPLLNLNSKGSSTHNNANKTHTSAATTTPTWKSSNRFTKCSVNRATKETPAKRPPPVYGWPNISQPSQQPVELLCGGAAVKEKISISRDQETNQLRLPQPKPVRVELHLSKCTWQEPAEISSGPACLMSMKSAIRSLSTPALSNGLNSTLRLGAQGRQMDNTDHVSCNPKTSKIHLAQMNKKESKEKTKEDV
ncbi:protein polyglycylase TTLL10 [Misgurnus anguillicaudatus]|uniref:protein polyglycylase TTLL10 n=1 Tax=Misgurnus anguillicaudatus TaxID=75329 RepID=UPI003CCF8597